MQAAINGAARVWHPKLVLNVGIGWGAGPDEGDMGQKLGDVMVALVVHKLGEGDVARGGNIDARETPGQVGIWISHIVRDTQIGWYSDVQPNPAWYHKRRITGRETKKYRALAGNVILFGMDTLMTRLLSCHCAMYTHCECQHALKEYHVLSLISHALKQSAACQHQCIKAQYNQ